LFGLSQHHQHHADKRQDQPQQLAGGEFLAEKQRSQRDQHKRLGVVHRGGNGNRRIRVGGKQQQPVDHQRHAAGYRQQQSHAREAIAPQLAQRSANSQQHQRTHRAAPEHHIDHRLAGHQYEPANGAGNQHCGDHLQRTALYLCIHGYFLKVKPMPLA